VWVRVVDIICYRTFCGGDSAAPESPLKRLSTCFLEVGMKMGSSAIASQRDGIRVLVPLLSAMSSVCFHHQDAQLSLRSAMGNKSSHKGKQRRDS
jgi:hypothetical protein